MRVALVAAVLCLSVLNLSAVSSAQAAVRQTTHIAPQGLGPALQALAKERNFQLVYRSEFVKDLHTQGAAGELTSDEALTQLLSGTGLAFRYLDDRTVTVFPISSTDTSSRPLMLVTGGSAQSPDERVSGSGSSKSLWNRFRLAQNDNSQSSKSADTSTQDEPDKNSPLKSPTDDTVDLGEVIVTGTNIRGVYPASSPVEIYTTEDIARTGATTTEQFMAKLPQNLGTRTQYSVGVTTAFNWENVNAVDLRGLGIGTTLTLLNGRRVALASNGQGADISLIPMSAVERVEVLTDGASAIYGSDAIGGVVNFVLRHDFDGAETRLGYGGVTSGGLQQGNFTQTFGHRWDSGNALVSYDYFDTSPLETADRPYAASSGPGTLTPDDVRHSALATFSQDLGDRVHVNADFAFSRRDVRNESANLTGAISVFSSAESETEQYFGNLGADCSISDSLNGSFLAGYSAIDVNTASVARYPALGLVLNTPRDTNYSVLDLTAKLDGSLFVLPAGTVRFSLGGGSMDEQYKSAMTPGGVVSGRDLGRITTYAFGELFVPLVGEEQDVPLVDRLEVSLAARYTSYDDASDPPLGREFGDKTSPKFGLLWSPLPALNIRATYGESFRAPTLTEIDPSGATGSLRQPFPIGGVNSTTLIVAGPSRELAPETSESYTLGFDYRPQTHPGFHLTATYFDIDYINRISDAAASTFSARANPDAWPDLVYHPSSAAQIEALLRATNVAVNQTGISLGNPQTASAALFALQDFWINDLRLRNLSLTRLDGFDLGIGDQFETSWGEISIGGQATRIFDYRERATSTSPVVTVVDTVLRPVDLRGRVYVGLTRGAFQSTVSVNYVDGYSNPLAGGAQDVESWTTVDWNMAYEFDSGSQGLLDGIRLSLSVQNVFDQDPPIVARNATALLLNPAGFDPANASPLGRFVMLAAAMEW